MSSFTPWTGTDIDVGAHLVPALADHARAHPGVPIAGADLLALARKAHPRDAILGRALPLGLAAKLAFVSAFCRHHGCPDLATLVPPAQIDPGVAHHDWHGLAVPLAAFAKSAHAAVPARFKARAERPADVAWYAYFRSHRAACDGVSAEGKKEIINRIMAGLDPETALAQVLAAQVSG